MKVIVIPYQGDVKMMTVSWGLWRHGSLPCHLMGGLCRDVPRRQD